MLNVDDAHGAALAADADGGALDLWTVSTARRRRACSARDIGYVDGGLAFDLVEGEQRCRARRR